MEAALSHLSPAESLIAGAFLCGLIYALFRLLRLITNCIDRAAPATNSYAPEAIVIFVTGALVATFMQLVKAA